MSTCGFCRSIWLKWKKTKDRQTLGSCQRVEKAVDHECDGDTNCTWYTWNGPQWPGEVTGGTGNKRKNQDQHDPSTIKII